MSTGKYSYSYLSQCLSWVWFCLLPLQSRQSPPGGWWVSSAPARSGPQCSASSCWGGSLLGRKSSVNGGVSWVCGETSRAQVLLSKRRNTKTLRLHLETCCWRSCSTARRMWWRWAGRAPSWTPCLLGRAAPGCPAGSPPLQKPTGMQDDGKQWWRSKKLESYKHIR